MVSNETYRRAVMIVRNEYNRKSGDGAKLEAAFKLLFWNESGFDHNRFTQAVSCAPGALNIRLGELYRGV